ncbi:unnamed protein product [Malus baccata var. baccata]
MFQCGGFAIGQCVSHKLADGLSNFVFTNTWAATARRDQADIDPPQFVSAALFPPPKEFNLGSGGSVPLTKDKVTRRYICNASEIETLRAKYQRNTKNVTSKRPSRVETLTAFIWNRFVGLQRVALRINYMMKLGKDTATLFGFSSPCGFPLYENDFGWGMPTWVVVFRDTKEGNGIEAYVSLEEKVMAKFECDSQLLSYVSPTGRVLMNYGN